MLWLLQDVLRICFDQASIANNGNSLLPFSGPQLHLAFWLEHLCGCSLWDLLSSLKNQSSASQVFLPDRYLFCLSFRTAGCLCGCFHSLCSTKSVEVLSDSGNVQLRSLYLFLVPWSSIWWPDRSVLFYKVLDEQHRSLISVPKIKNCCYICKRSGFWVIIYRMVSLCSQVSFSSSYSIILALNKCKY